MIGEGKRMRRGSTGDIEDLWKRKREKMEIRGEEIEKEEIFKRSKKVMRSSGDKK